MIKFTISGIQRIYQSREKLRELKREMPEQIERALNRFGLRVVRMAKKEYLSGPRPEKVGVVTGLLRAEMRHEVNRHSDSRLSVRIGNRVPYAAIHEYGFHGKVNVPSHIRVIKQAFGRKLRFPVTVRVNPYSMTQNIKERPFLTPSFNRNLPSLKSDLVRIMKRAKVGEYVE